MSKPNAFINTYYQRAKVVKTLKAEPKVLEYLQAVKEMDEVKEQATKEMAKEAITKSKGASVYRKYKFGEVVVNMRTTTFHHEPKEAYDDAKNYLTIE